jgi:hypothetical protein
LPQIGKFNEEVGVYYDLREVGLLKNMAARYNA